jgi:uncharacterized Zn-binding protein involved in type VI secretion
MPGIAVCNMDSAGGMIRTGPNVGVTYNGQPLAVVGCPVEDHGSGQHRSATMIQGSVGLAINGLPVCYAGSRASCNDVATGRPNLTVSA